MNNTYTFLATGLAASLVLPVAVPLAAAAAGASPVAAGAAADAADRTSVRENADAERADAPANARAITLIENATEAVAEAETTGDQAIGAARRAVGMWAGARDKLAANGAPEAQLARASASIAGLREALETHADLRRSANDVTGALAPLFAYNGDGTPAAIHTLDYLGRSIALDAGEGNWTRAAHDTSSLRATWQDVRARVLGRAHGPLAAARYENVVATLERAARSRDAAGTAAAAKRTLDGVDALEKTFGA
ncbi:MAG: hypothetical protein NVSMB19_00120 [Vulcanimicrobiaceae bacterium]